MSYCIICRDTKDPCLCSTQRANVCPRCHAFPCACRVAAEGKTMSSINCKKCGLPVSSVTNECLTGGQCLYDIPAAPPIHPTISITPADVIGPTRASTFPTDAAWRKKHPVASGLLDYFPDAVVAIARVSFEGNEQHNPGTELHWARNKSSDESDALMRHFLQRGELDSDGLRHTAKMAWRALALLQKEIESEQ